MNYSILTAKPKDLAEKIKELTGEKPVYLGVPSCGYKVDGITINRDGSITLDEDANEDLINKLLENELIRAEEVENSEDETSEDETTDEPQGAAEAEASGEADQTTADLDEAPDSAENLAEETNCEPDGTDDTEATEPETIKPEYSFPISKHTAESLKNLIFTIYSKGDLMSKSSGGEFFVSDSLKDELKTEDLTTTERVTEVIKNSGADDLKGIAIEDDKVTFTGFPETDDPNTVKAWLKLAEAINKTAIKQGHIQAKRNTETNQKFAFRTWVTRLGLTGSEYKTERAIYYKNLTGHTAFRTPADEERWKKRQAERKAEREAKASDQDEEETA